LLHGWRLFVAARQLWVVSKDYEPKAGGEE
jgi:hypothetical protein